MSEESGEAAAREEPPAPAPTPAARRNGKPPPPLQPPPQPPHSPASFSAAAPGLQPLPPPLLQLAGMPYAAGPYAMPPWSGGACLGPGQQQQQQLGMGSEMPATLDRSLESTDSLMQLVHDAAARAVAAVSGAPTSSFAWSALEDAANWAAVEAVTMVLAGNTARSPDAATAAAAYAGGHQPPPTPPSSQQQQHSAPSSSAPAVGRWRTPMFRLFMNSYLERR